MIEINTFVLISVHIKNNQHPYEYINNTVDQLIKKFHGKYNIDLNNDNCSIKISIPLM